MSADRQVAFFDLDGTLTDPKVGIVGSIRHALAALDVESPADDDLTWCIGPPLLASFEHLVGPDRAPQALTLYRERFSEIGWRENLPYPGISLALQQLVDAGFELHVATSKPHVYARRIIEHFGLRGFFGEVFGSELDGTRAAKGALLQYALTQIAPSSGAVMVGDRKFDMLGARENGLTPVGVSYGYGSEAELRNAGASCIVADPRRLPDALAAR